jgi:hypothetical protein
MGTLRSDQVRDVNTDIGDLVKLVDVGGGSPGLPALDGSQLINVPASSSLSAVLTVGNVTGANDIVVSTGQVVRGVDAATGLALALRGGASSGAGVVGGAATLTGGRPTDGNGGPVLITAESGFGTNRSGGDITLTPGAKTGTGAIGLAKINGSLIIGTTNTPIPIAAGDIVVGQLSQPLMVFRSSIGTFYVSNAGGGAAVLIGNARGVSVGSALSYEFSSTTNPFGAPDVALTRAAAGVVKVGNGVGGDGTLEAATVQLGSGGPTLINSGGVPLSSTGLFAGTLGTARPASFAAGDAYFGLTGSGCLVYDQSAGAFEGYNSSNNSTSVWRLSTAFGLRGLQLGTGYDARLQWATTGSSTVPEVTEVGWNTTLTDATATAILEATVGVGTSVGGTIDVTVHATDGTDMQSLTCQVFYAAVNKAGTITVTATAIAFGNPALSNGGTFTVAADATTGAGVAIIRLTATSSLTTTSLVANCHARSLCSQAITPE